MQRLGYRLDDREIGVRFLAGDRDFSSPHYPDGSGDHQASYRMRTWGLFPGCENTSV
jgi:hypothetical protein